MAAFTDNFIRICGSRMLAALIAINVVVFLIAWIVILSGPMFGLSGNFTMQWLCVPASVAGFAIRPWTIITYMVTHYDFLHLLFNMLWLFWFGIMLAPQIGHKRFLILYGAGGITGAIFYLATSAIWAQEANPGAYLCGASASVLSIMAAATILIPNREIYLFLIGGVKLKWATLACIGLTFLGLGGGNLVAQSAHVGGVAFGLIFAALRLYNQKKSAPAKTSAHREYQPDPVRRTIRLNVRRRDGNAVAKAASGRLSDMARLDELLDKIRISGYASLSTGERNELNAISSRLDKTPSPN